VSVQRLHPDDVEQIAAIVLDRLADLVADRLAERLDVAAGRGPSLVDVKTLAQLLGVSADFVRENAAALGGFRIADGPRAPWRFDIEEARAKLAARGASKQSIAPQSAAPAGRRSRSRSRASATAGRTLAIRGPEA
jgi:hypothetical protein